MTKLNVSLPGLELKNPLLLASGTCNYGREFAELYDLRILGGIVVKGTTLNPRKGNPPPRIVETASGLLNSVGLQNPGVDKVINEEIPFLRKFDTAIILNIAGHSEEDYAVIAEKLDSVEGIGALEVNISCPNVASGGMAFGTDCLVASRVTKKVRESTKLPMIVKLSPNVTNISEIAKAVEAAGADMVSLVNTFMGMAIDVRTRRPVMPNIVGGLSGPAIKPLALRMVWQVAKAVDIPVIGMGGIITATDAVEFMLAGAHAFQIGAASFHDPMAAVSIIQELEVWLDNEGVKDIKEIVGGLVI